MTEHHSAEMIGKAKSCLERAHIAAGAPALSHYGDLLADGEVLQATDVLASYGEERADLGRSFWGSLADAYDALGRTAEAERSRARA